MFSGKRWTWRGVQAIIHNTLTQYYRFWCSRVWEVGEITCKYVFLILRHVFNFENALRIPTSYILIIYNFGNINKW